MWKSKKDTVNSATIVKVDYVCTISSLETIEKELSDEAETSKRLRCYLFE